MQIISLGDSLHEMSIPVFWGKKKTTKNKIIAIINMTDINLLLDPTVSKIYSIYPKY